MTEETPSALKHACSHDTANIRSESIDDENSSRRTKCLIIIINFNVKKHEQTPWTLDNRHRHRHRHGHNASEIYRNYGKKKKEAYIEQTVKLMQFIGGNTNAIFKLVFR